MEAERFPAMCGKATLATEESSTTMKVESMTDTAIIHGLAEGVHSAGSTAVFGGAPPVGLIRRNSPAPPSDSFGG